MGSEEGLGDVLSIFQAAKGEDDPMVRELLGEYLAWAISMVNREFGVDFDLEAMLEQDMVELDKYLPPHGRLLLAEFEGHVAGVACMRRIGLDTGEIKRMYVRPQFRRKGIGRALAERLIQESRGIGYPRLRLDSPRSWKPSHALYHAMGFREIEPYPESEIPAEFQEHWIFMELPLVPTRRARGR
jgi:GNAT superfamily N-acetyltransferase